MSLQDDWYRIITLVQAEPSQHPSLHFGFDSVHSIISPEMLPTNRAKSADGQLGSQSLPSTSKSQPWNPNASIMFNKKNLSIQPPPVTHPLEAPKASHGEKNVKKVCLRKFSKLISQQYNNSKIIHKQTITTNQLYLIHSIKS